MRTRTTLTPIVSAGLAAVAAGSLFAFSVVAQRTGLPGSGRGVVVPAVPSVQLPAITLPGSGVEAPPAVESAREGGEPIVSAPITISELPADQASAPAARGGGAGPSVSPNSSGTQRADKLGKDRDRAAKVQEVAGPMSTAGAWSPTSGAAKGKAYGHTAAPPGPSRGRDDHQGSHSRAAAMSESSSHESNRRHGRTEGHHKKKSPNNKKKS